MPRVETPEKPEDREVRDLCRSCYKREAAVLAEDGWEVGVQHPPYEHHSYHCFHCGQLLSKVDNLWELPAREVPDAA